MNRRHALRQLHAQEGRLLDRSEAAADAVEAAVRAVWRKLLRILQPGQPWALTQRLAAEVLRELPAVLGAVAEQLGDAVADSFAGVRRALPNTNIRIPVFSRATPLIEDNLTQLAFDVLLPGPTADQVHALVYASGWQRRLAQLTRLADPESLASTVAAALAGGATPREAAKAILPFVQEVQASARRVARHEVIRVAHEARLAAYEELGEDFVVGYQVHAVNDSRTRPEHRKRDGTVYYRRPEAGQLGFADMPRPPYEADGTIAWNCRCYVTPVLT